MRTFPLLSVDAEDAAILREWVASGDRGASAVRRARIVLLSADGLGPTAVASEVGCSKQTVITWRERYRTDGVAGLKDAPRSGRPVTVDPVAVVERTLEVPPPGLRARRWSSRLLAAELGVSNVAVANIWRSWGVVPMPEGHVRLATEPPLDPPIRSVAGVYFGPELQVAALVVGEGGPTRVPLLQRPRLGDRFDELDPGDGGGSTPAEVAHFLDGLAVPPSRLRLLVTVVPPQLDAWAARSGVGVHVVPPGLDWSRLVRIVVVEAGGTERGRGAAAALRRAVLAHPPGRPFRWRDPTLVAHERQ